MHQAVREFTIRCENQEARSIEIESSDRYPTAAPEARQTIEHRRASLRIIPRANLPDRFVVEQDPGWGCGY